MDFDAEAVANARQDVKGSEPEARCAECGRSIYRERPFPGVPIEWRHHSTGQPISWSPSKHLAGRVLVEFHVHRFPPRRTGTIGCTIEGCEAVMPVLDRAALRAAAEARKNEAKSGKEAAMAHSRALGAHRGRVTQKSRNCPM